MGRTSPRSAQARPEGVKTPGGGSSSNLAARAPISNRNTARNGSPMCVILKDRNSPNPGKLRNTRARERSDLGPQAANAKSQHCQEWVADVLDSKRQKIAESRRNIKIRGGSTICLSDPSHQFPNRHTARNGSPMYLILNGGKSPNPGKLQSVSVENWSGPGQDLQWEGIAVAWPAG